MFSIKKILILLVFICGFASLISKTEANASTYSLSDYVTISGIGHTINVVEANNVQDFIMGCTVLEPVFLEDVLQLYRFNSGHTNYFSGTYSSMADMYSDISDEIYSDYNVSGLYSGFYGSVSLLFQVLKKIH